jgi:hypothetical protein
VFAAARYHARPGRLEADWSQEMTMPKGQQRSNKESKKQKKDSAPPKPISPTLPSITTVVPDRSKKKK